MHSAVMIANKNSSKSAISLDAVVQQLGLPNSHTAVIDYGDNVEDILPTLLKKKPKRIIVAGGDGTILVVVESLLHEKYKGEVAVVPLGTSNYLARMLKVSLDPLVAATDALTSKNTEAVLLPQVNNKLFLFMVTIGLTTQAADQLTDDLKRKAGQFAYVMSVCKQFLLHKPFDYMLQTDDETIEGTAHEIIVYSHDVNQQLPVLPRHSNDRKTVRITVFSNKNKFKLAWALLVHILTAGKIRLYIKTLEAKKVHIKTSPIRQAGHDGEVISQSPLFIESAVHRITFVTKS